MDQVCFGVSLSLQHLSMQETSKKSVAEEYVDFFKDAGLAFYMRYDLSVPVEENIKNNIMPTE